MIAVASTGNGLASSPEAVESMEPASMRVPEPLPEPLLELPELLPLDPELLLEPELLPDPLELPDPTFSAVASEPPEPASLTAAVCPPHATTAKSAAR